MADLEREVCIRYLDHLDDETWDDEDPRLDFGPSALPHFIAAFDKETVPERRARLIRVIWQFRDPAALPTLAIAIRDESAEVWKDALDGIVALGGEQVLSILEEGRAAATTDAEKSEWIDEAVNQVAERIG